MPVAKLTTTLDAETSSLDAGLARAQNGLRGVAGTAANTAAPALDKAAGAANKAGAAGGNAAQRVGGLAGAFGAVAGGGGRAQQAVAGVAQAAAQGGPIVAALAAVIAVTTVAISKLRARVAEDFAAIGERAKTLKKSMETAFANADFSSALKAAKGEAAGAANEIENIDAKLAALKTRATAIGADFKELSLDTENVDTALEKIAGWIDGSTGERKKALEAAKEELETMRDQRVQLERQREIAKAKMESEKKAAIDQVEALEDAQAQAAIARDIAKEEERIARAKAEQERAAKAVSEFDKQRTAHRGESESRDKANAEISRIANREIERDNGESWSRRFREMTRTGASGSRRDRAIYELLNPREEPTTKLEGLQNQVRNMQSQSDEKAARQRQEQIELQKKLIEKLSAPIG